MYVAVADNTVLTRVHNAMKKKNIYKTNLKSNTLNSVTEIPGNSVSISKKRKWINFLNYSPNGLNRRLVTRQTKTGLNKLK